MSVDHLMLVYIVGVRIKKGKNGQQSDLKKILLQFHCLDFFTLRTFKFLTKFPLLRGQKRTL